jgi:glucose/arabinose dehydrogenase
MKHTRILSLLFLAFLMMQCNDKQSQQTPTFKGDVITTDKQKFGIDTLAEGLENPWGIAFLPDGRMLVTERKGEIRIIENGKLIDSKVDNVPSVFAKGQGGLLDITLHPDYASNGWIYLTYSKPGEDGTSATTLTRTKITGNAFTETEELFSALPFTNSDYHFGSRIVFDKKGHVFISSGERGTKPNSQDLSNHLGKVIRLNEDGTVPSDNPFVNTPNAKPEIWSYGHRNPQGLFYDTTTDTFYEVEHGPKGGDELNIVQPGNNYGWPVITYGIDYDGSIISDLTEKEGMEQPIHYWVPSIATCGMTKLKGDKYPGWKENIFVGALAATHVARVELQDGNVVATEKILDKVGRVRAVSEGPDGYLYVVTEAPGYVLRLIPVE